MIPPKFISFPQADTGLPASVCISVDCAVESVYAQRRGIDDLVCECGHAGSEHGRLKGGGAVLAVRCGECACAELRLVATQESRTVIRMRTGQKYEVLESVATVVARIKAVSERDG